MDIEQGTLEMDIEHAKNQFESACMENDIETIKTIFTKYVDSDSIFKDGYTLLACSGHSETLKYLLDNTKYKNIDDELKYWIFINGASNNHKNIVELILQYNFNIDYASDYQCTPIEYCDSRNNRKEILELLINFIQTSKKCCNTYEALLNEIERLKNKIENIKKYVKNI